MSETDLETVEKRLLELEKEIAETCKRLPAHSAKPPVMMDLIQLEDERDFMLEKKKVLLNGLK